MLNAKSVWIITAESQPTLVALNSARRQKTLDKKPASQTIHQTHLCNSVVSGNGYALVSTLAKVHDEERILRAMDLNVVDGRGSNAAKFGKGPMESR